MNRVFKVLSDLRADTESPRFDASLTNWSDPVALDEIDQLMLTNFGLSI